MLWEVRGLRGARQPHWSGRVLVQRFLVFIKLQLVPINGVLVVLGNVVLVLDVWRTALNDAGTRMSIDRIPRSVVSLRSPIHSILDRDAFEFLASKHL